MFFFIALLVFQSLGAAESEPCTALAAGFMAGASEPFIAQPLTTLKNRAQLAKQAHIQLPPLTIKELWRGVPIAALSLGADTGLQMGLNAICMPYVPNVWFRTLVAGAASAYILGGPSELIITQQQIHAEVAYKTISRVYRNAGILGFWRGANWLAIREAKFSWGYLYLAPQCTAYFKKQGMADFPAKIAGGICGGFVAMMVSHPADTIKTRMVADFPSSSGAKFRYRTGIDVVKEMVRTEGSLASLYKGSLPRVANGTFAITWFATITPYIVKKITNS
jgi:hypothetical protein